MGRSQEYECNNPLHTFFILPLSCFIIFSEKANDNALIDAIHMAHDTWPYDERKSNAENDPKAEDIKYLHI